MSIRVSLLASLAPPLPERDCKGTTFFFPSKSFRNFFPTFFRAGHRRQARQTAEAPVWHAVARLRPPGRIFSGARRKRLSPAQTGKRPEKKSRHRTDAQLPREKDEAPGRSSMCSTGGTQSRDATAIHIGKSWPDGGCRPNIKKRPDRHSSQASYHIRTQGPCTSLHHAAHSGCRSCNRFLLRNLCNCALSGQEHPGN